MKITKYEYKGYTVERFGRRWLVEGKGLYETTYTGSHKSLADCKSFIDYLVKENSK